MGREVKRVPLDFDWPQSKVWEGFITPPNLRGQWCGECDGSGQTDFGWWLQNFCYVMAMLANDVQERRHPHPVRGYQMHPWLKKFPRAHVRAEYFKDDKWQSPGELFRQGLMPGEDFRKLAYRCPVVPPSDDALMFFHGILKNHHKWKFQSDHEYADLYDPDDLPPADQIGESGIFSSSRVGASNIQHALVELLQRESGVSFGCQHCDGKGATEEYEGQFAEREAWEPYEPPTGDGWQLWETVSEGSPISPVFATAEDLAQWLTTPEGGDKTGPSRQPLPIAVARRFVQSQWAPSGFSSPETGWVDGTAWVGGKNVEEGDTDG